MVLSNWTYKLKLIALLIGSSAFIVASNLIPPHHMKRMEKRVEKFFGSTVVHLDMDHQFIDSAAKGYGHVIPIVSASDSLMAYLCYRETTACNFGGCTDTSCKTSGSSDFKEIIHYYAIMSKYNEVLKVGILEYESRYGYEITSNWWLKQFNDKPAGDFKLTDNINGITGATVSVKAMIDDINSIKVKRSPSSPL